jgi:hypothetical protein
MPALVRQIAEAGVESPVDTRDTSFYLQGGAEAQRPSRNEPLAPAPLPRDGVDLSRARRLLPAASAADDHARRGDRVLRVSGGIDLSEGESCVTCRSTRTSTFHSRAFLVQRVQRVEAIVWSVGWLG